MAFTRNGVASSTSRNSEAPQKFKRRTKSNGNAILEMQKKHEQVMEQREAQRNKMFTFFVKPGEERKVIFLDFGIGTDGGPSGYAYHQHSLYDENKPKKERYQSYVCLSDFDDEDGRPMSCPLCEEGDEPKHIVCGAIIDLTPYKKADGTVVPYSRMLYAAGPKSWGLLQKQWAKRKGLQGKVFEIGRAEKKSTATGDIFDYVDTITPEQALADYGVKVEDWTLPDYEDEIGILTEQQLREMGFGLGPAAGSEQELPDVPVTTDSDQDETAEALAAEMNAEDGQL